MNARSMIAGMIPLALAASALAAPVEDEAHRLDRLETKRLNERSAAQGQPRRAAVPPLPTRQTTAAEQELRTREQRALDSWRRSVEACRAAGQRDDC